MEARNNSFFNGTSSSGKTSISTELLNQNEIPFRHLSIDDFFHGLFHDYIDFINTKCSKSADREDVVLGNVEMHNIAIAPT
ncbi:phosphotransferase-like protein [Aureibacillus halotolerans]|uniref:phosphotransferase-like protein n=1 Tax=Aureibacillus halotolerans TaxID=1508390 RepID=UPI00105FB932